jgi:hypothetical protein
MKRPDVTPALTRVVERPRDVGRDVCNPRELLKVPTIFIGERDEP